MLQLKPRLLNWTHWDRNTQGPLHEYEWSNQARIKSTGPEQIIANYKVYVVTSDRHVSPPPKKKHNKY